MLWLRSGMLDKPYITHNGAVYYYYYIIRPRESYYHLPTRRLRVLPAGY